VYAAGIALVELDPLTICTSPWGDCQDASRMTVPAQTIVRVEEGPAGVTATPRVTSTRPPHHVPPIAAGSVGPPANDDIAHATPIRALPFSRAVTTAGATAGADDSSCISSSAIHTVWYTFTPTRTMRIGLSTGLAWAVVTGSPGDLALVACNGGRQTWTAAAGTRYYIELASDDGQPARLLGRMPAPRSSARTRRSKTRSSHYNGAVHEGQHGCADGNRRARSWRDPSPGGSAPQRPRGGRNRDHRAQRHPRRHHCGHSVGERSELPRRRDAHDLVQLHPTPIGHFRRPGGREQRGRGHHRIAWVADGDQLQHEVPVLEADVSGNGRCARYLIQVAACCSAPGPSTLSLRRVHPFDVVVSVDPTGTVTDGVATITGTITCSHREDLRNTDTEWDPYLTEAYRGFEATWGDYYSIAVCTPTGTRFSFQAFDFYSGIAFGPGTAYFDMPSDVGTCTEFLCARSETDPVGAAVKLQ
jgi:hypothetical protein